MLDSEEMDREVRYLQILQEVPLAPAAPVDVPEQASVKRRLQAWHYLIPILTGFLMVFGIVLISSGLLFLAVSALAVIAALSVLVVALAWAFQNDI